MYQSVPIFACIFAFQEIYCFCFFALDCAAQRSHPIIIGGIDVCSILQKELKEINLS